jgi:hypothetical protein
MVKPTTGEFVPYKTGETPMIGDKVEDRLGRKATVAEVQQGLGQMADDKLTVKWDESVVTIGDYPASDFLLVSR